LPFGDFATGTRSRVERHHIWQQLRLGIAMELGTEMSRRRLGTRARHQQALVGGAITILKNDGVRQLGALFPNIWKHSPNVPNHQPASKWFSIRR